MGYWAVNIVTGVPKAIPLIGSPLVELLRGSASVGQSLFFYSLQYFCIASSYCCIYVDALSNDT